MTGPVVQPPAGARLVSTGSVVADLPLYVPQLPPRGGDVLATTPGTVAGGGFNVVAAAARHGAAVALASPVGTGPHGTLVREALTREGVELVVPAAAGETGLVVTLVEPDGERTFVTTVGVEGRPRAEDLAAVAVRPGDVVYVSGYDLTYPGAGVVAAWAAGLPAGVRLLVDPGPLAGEIAAELLGAVLARCDVLTINAHEAATLAANGDAGARPDTEAGPADLTALRARVPPGCAVLVRVGAAGCWVSEAAGAAAVLVPSTPVRPVDSTGAGDTHTGVLAAGLLAGRPLVETVRRANVAAALSVLRPGPATAPTAAELDAHLLRGPTGEARRAPRA
ncbi:PfkB family carbohydrate kinase [Georgenia sp. AZ-5]|uniref:PfkB family carbohydrate kinase n=1 Tax=Georgenia sp. AZ-5 TaxID=3367526 RepID=UPI0037551C4B